MEEVLVFTKIEVRIIHNRHKAYQGMSYSFAVLGDDSVVRYTFRVPSSIDVRVGDLVRWRKHQTYDRYKVLETDYYYSYQSRVEVADSIKRISNWEDLGVIVNINTGGQMREVEVGEA